MLQYIQAKPQLESLKTITDYRMDSGKIEYSLHEGSLYENIRTAHMSRLSITD